MQAMMRKSSAHRGLRRLQNSALSAPRQAMNSAAAHTAVTGPMTMPPILGVPFLFRWLCGPSSYMV